MGRERGGEEAVGVGGGHVHGEGVGGGGGDEAVGVGKGHIHGEGAGGGMRLWCRGRQCPLRGSEMGRGGGRVKLWV